MLFMLVPVCLDAHYTWIIPAEKEKAMLICHGHSFPVSEQALSPEGLRVKVLFPGAAPADLILEKRPAFLAAPLGENAPDPRGAILVQEAQIITRTTSGVKIGPMSSYSGVIDSFRRLRCAAFQSAPGVELAAEPDYLLLLLERREGLLRLNLRLGEKPLAAVKIKVIQPGRPQEQEVGETDSHGFVRFDAAQEGYHLFSASFSRDVENPDYKREQYSTTLSVLIE